MSAQANAVSRQGMLFGDPLEGIETDEVGYRGPIACSAAGITYRQLDYWARTGLLQPSIRAARGSGSQRLYSFRDILVLKIYLKCFYSFTLTCSSCACTIFHLILPTVILKVRLISYTKILAYI